ncbi:hypothetical protein O181_030739 [Austropuccinia psidii MF-1]|uniref:Uncharacterized protein n=1 Tax=Austropuccinia psidii MF-1 TaxID=1389203 RepID=A0A9Q3CTG7_9BASI|nr:hypothetical protein [Austropuccinia psidii MF-1]
MAYGPRTIEAIGGLYGPNLPFRTQTPFTKGVGQRTLINLEGPEAPGRVNDPPGPELRYWPGGWWDWELAKKANYAGYGLGL